MDSYQLFLAGYEISPDDPLLEGLSERDKLVLIQRQPFLPKAPNSLKQIARNLRISRQRVLQIERKAAAVFAAKVVAS